MFSVAFSPDGTSLVSGSLDRTLKVWDLTNTRRIADAPGPKPAGSHGVCASSLAGHKDYVLSVGITPDGQWIVSGSKDRTIQFWNTTTGDPQMMLQGHKNSGKQLMSPSPRKVGDRLLTLPYDAVISIDLAKAKNLMASGSGDCHARIWEYLPV